MDDFSSRVSSIVLRNSNVFGVLIPRSSFRDIGASIIIYTRIGKC